MDKQLNDIGSKFVSIIKNEFDSKGLNYTGKAKASISYKVQNRKLIIEGLARTLFLEFGRRAGTPPPFNVIKEWVEKKLQPPESAVWIITKTIVDKIAREGTDILNDRTKGLQLELVLSDLNEQLLNEIAIFEAGRITEGLFKTWQ